MNGIDFSSPSSLASNNELEFASPEPTRNRQLADKAVAVAARRVLNFNPKEEEKLDENSSCTFNSPSRGNLSKKTPAKVRRAKQILVEAEAGLDLPNGDLTAVQQGMKALKKAVTPQRNKYTAAMHTAITEKFGPKSSLGSPGYQQRMAAGLRDNPQLAQLSGQLHRLNPEIPRHYILIEHVAERHIRFEKTSVLDEIENQRTGVTCGMVGKTFTTFYPRAIQSQAQLVELLNSSELVMKGDKHLELVRVPARDEIPEFHVEMAKRHDAVVVTAYPVFFFGQYAEGKEYEICKGVSFSSKKIHEFLEELSEDYIRYQSQQETIVDLAEPIAEFLKLGGSLPEGIYFSFPRKLADQLLFD